VESQSFNLSVESRPLNFILKKNININENNNNNDNNKNKNNNKNKRLLHGLWRKG
jgi:hypothetical protein